MHRDNRMDKNKAFYASQNFIAPNYYVITNYVTPGGEPLMYPIPSYDHFGIPPTFMPPNYVHQHPQVHQNNFVRQEPQQIEEPPAPKDRLDPIEIEIIQKLAETLKNLPADEMENMDSTKKEELRNKVRADVLERKKTLETLKSSITEKIDVIKGKEEKRKLREEVENISKRLRNETTSSLTTLMAEKREGKPMEEILKQIEEENDINEAHKEIVAKAKVELMESARKGKKYLYLKSVEQLQEIIETKAPGESWLEMSERELKKSQQNVNENLKQLGMDSDDDLIDDLDLLGDGDLDNERDDETVDLDEAAIEEEKQQLIEKNYHLVIFKIQNVYKKLSSLGCSVDALIVYKGLGRPMFDSDGKIMLDTAELERIQAELDAKEAAEKLLMEQKAQPKEEKIKEDIKNTDDVGNKILDEVKNVEKEEGPEVPIVQAAPRNVKRIKYSAFELAKILDLDSLAKDTNMMKEMNIYKTSSAKERKVVEKVRFTNLGTSTDAMILGKDNKKPLKDVIRHFNRLTPANFGECFADCEAAVSKIYSNLSLVQECSESLLNSIVNTTLSILPLVYFFKELSKNYPNVCEGVSAGCVKLFESRHDPNPRLDELKQRLVELTKETKSGKEVDSLTIDIVDIEEKHKTMVARSASLYSWLYNLDLVKFDAFESFLRKLISSKVGTDIVCLCRIITIVGKKLLMREKKMLDSVIDLLHQFTKYPEKTVVFTVMDLIDDYKSGFKLGTVHRKNEDTVLQIKQSSKDYSNKIKHGELKAQQPKQKSVKVDEEGFITVGAKTWVNLDSKFSNEQSRKSNKKTIEDKPSEFYTFLENNAPADDPLMDVKMKSLRIGSNVAESKEIRLSRDEIEDKARRIISLVETADKESALSVFKDVCDTKSVSDFLSCLYIEYCDQSSRMCKMLREFYEFMSKSNLLKPKMILDMSRITLKTFDEDEFLGEDYPRFVEDFADIVLICSGFKPDVGGLFAAIGSCETKDKFIFSVMNGMKDKTSKDQVLKCWTASNLNLSDFATSGVTDDLASLISQLSI